MGILKLILGIFLLTATQEFPYGYYQFLRLIVFLSMGIIIYLEHKALSKFMLSCYVLLGILFNPILPIFLDKGTWFYIDIIAGILMTSVGVKDLYTKLKSN